MSTATDSRSARCIISTEIHGKGLSDVVRERFIRNHGPDLIHELLSEAGLATGQWTFRLTGCLKVCATTPPLQVRRPEAYGVILWVRPAGNDSGVKGVLVLTRDRQLTTEALYAQLKTALVRVQGQAPPPATPPAALKPLELDDTDALLLLDAIHEASDAPGMDDFIADVSERLDADTYDPHFCLEAAELLVERGLLLDRKTRYVLTEAGLARLRQGQPAKPAATPLTQVNASESLGLEQVGDLLLQTRERMNRMLTTAGTVQSSRDRQKTLAVKVKECRERLAEAERELAQERAKEAELVRGIPIEALLWLLEGSKEKP